MATQPLTGYGPSNKSRLIFDGDERHFELWLVKFMGYMRIRGLHSVVTDGHDVNREKNSEFFAELVQVLDDRSLSLIIRDAQDDGQKAIHILKEHYQPKGKSRIITLYTQLTSLEKLHSESTTDYILRAESTASYLRDAGEIISDSLLVAMVLKGLPKDFKPFTAVITQKDKSLSFQDFKDALRNYEDTEEQHNSSVMLTNSKSHHGRPQRSRWCEICKTNSHDTSFCRKKTSMHAPKSVYNSRYSTVCKSSTHDTKVCRKLKSAKLLRDSDSSHRLTQNQETDNNFIFTCSDRTDRPTIQQVNSFLVDSGATVHIVNDKEKFLSLKKDTSVAKHIIELADGSRPNDLVKGQGDVQITRTDTENVTHDVILKDVLYVPSFSQNIFSVKAATEKGSSVIFHKDIALLSSGNTSFPIAKDRNLYFLNSVKSVTNSKRTLKEWHEALEHCNFSDLLMLLNVVLGMDIIDSPSLPVDCEVCTLD